MLSIIFKRYAVLAMKGMKLLLFDFDCSLPDNKYSVEQAHIGISDLLSGNYVPPKSRLDYGDCEADLDDDFDDLCSETADLDMEFETSIFEGKKLAHQEVKQDKEVQDEE